MKRLLLITAACLAAALPLGGSAFARDGDREHRREAQYERGGDRGDNRGQGRRGEDRRGEDRRGYEPRGSDWRIEDRRDRGPPPRYERREEPRRDYDRPPAYAPNYMREPAPRRGGSYAPDYRPASPEDSQRYRLRPAPRGFNWVRMGNGFALVGPDGRVFDRVD